MSQFDFYKSGPYPTLVESNGATVRKNVSLLADIPSATASVSSATLTGATMQRKVSLSACIPSATASMSSTTLTGATIQ